MTFLQMYRCLPPLRRFRYRFLSSLLRQIQVCRAYSWGNPLYIISTGSLVSPSTVNNPASISSSKLPETEVLVPAPAFPSSEGRAAGRRPADLEPTVEGVKGARTPAAIRSSPVGSSGSVTIPGEASAVARRPPRLNHPPIRPSSALRLVSLTPNPANGSLSQAEIAGLPASDSNPGSYVSSPTGSSHGSDGSTVSPHPFVSCGSDGSTAVSNQSTTEAVSPWSSQSSFYTDTPPPPRTVIIEGLNKYELYEAVCPETMREWEAAPGPKVIVFIANDSVTTEIHRRVTLIRNALISLFPDANPIIGSAEVVTTGLGPQPVLPFLVHRISVRYSHRLTTQCCWTVNNFTFFAVPFNALPTTS